MKGKTWFRRDLKAISDEAKGAGIEPGYQANMSIKTPSPQDEARNDVPAGMRESFGQLAQAAVAKSDTIDAHAATIAALYKTIAELTSTNAILVTALVAKESRTIAPPPGFNPTVTVTANTTGHTVNSAGIACPMKKKFGRMSFVVPQHCAVCNKAEQWHLPQNCLEAPHNTTLKAKILTRRAADKAVKAAQTAATN